MILCSSLLPIEKVELYNARLLRTIRDVVYHRVAALLHDIITRGLVLENLVDLSITLISYDQLSGLDHALKTQLRDYSLLEVFDFHILVHGDVKHFENVQFVFSLAFLVF